ncbi:thioredoxin family protein [Bergeyella zoohelcum]|uniref:thioredoxin family protein n=1 Tax=Bergeyella zoohelcum TaxID=1015 RepID=UPI0037362FC6
MKKIISSTLFAITLLSITHCSPQKKVINREVEHSQHGKMLLGLQSLSQFEKAPFNTWYSQEKSEYQLDSKGMQQLKKQKLHTFKITAFVGTWCEDSHREFPRFIRILEELQYPIDKLEIITVNTKKQSPTGEEVINNIHKVPTFIVSKYGKEVGRITEFPKSGYIERDLVEITNTFYKNNKNPFN